MTSSSNQMSASEISTPSSDLQPTDIRVMLASALLDVLLMADDSITENQRAFTGDMMTAVAPFLPDDFLAEMSVRLSRRHSLAPSLLRVMLLGQVEVARPMLERMSNIPDGLLIEAMRISRGHQRAVASRFRISETVADALFEDGTPALRVALLMRDEVPLAPHRVAKLVAQTKVEPSLRMPLLGRAELQPGSGFTMFWWLDANQRKRVFSRFALSREPIQDILAPLYLEVFTDAKSDPVARGILSLCDRRHRPRNKLGKVVPMPAVEQMLRAVRSNPTEEFCVTTGLLAGIAHQTTRRVMDDVGGEPFAVLCKSLGVARGRFADIMRDAAQRRVESSYGPAFDDAQQEHLMTTFDTIARDYARTILRYWDWQEAMVALEVAGAGAPR